MKRNGGASDRSGVETCRFDLRNVLGVGCLLALVLQLMVLLLRLWFSRCLFLSS